MQRLDRRDGKRKVFVIRVLVTKENSHPRYIYGLGDKFHPAKRDFDATGMITHKKTIRTVHIYANNIKKANEEAAKYGKVLNGNEGHSQKTIYGDIENVLKKKKKEGEHGTALELEEMPWLYIQKEKEREKVRDRRSNTFKDKPLFSLDF